MSDARWRVDYTPRARQEMRRLDPPIRARVIAAIEDLRDEPRQARGVRRLSGRPELRLRVGDWRAIFQLQPRDRVVLVLRVLPRGRSYR